MNKTVVQLARDRPTSNYDLFNVDGLAEQKIREYGAAITSLIRRASEELGLQTDCNPRRRPSQQKKQKQKQKQQGSEGGGDQQGNDEVGRPVAIESFQFQPSSSSSKAAKVQAKASFDSKRPPPPLSSSSSLSTTVPASGVRDGIRPPSAPMPT